MAEDDFHVRTFVVPELGGVGGGEEGGGHIHVLAGQATPPRLQGPGERPLYRVVLSHQHVTSLKKRRKYKYKY